MLNLTCLLILVAYELRMFWEFLNDWKDQNKYNIWWYMIILKFMTIRKALFKSFIIAPLLYMLFLAAYGLQWWSWGTGKKWRGSTTWFTVSKHPWDVPELTRAGSSTQEHILTVTSSVFRIWLLLALPVKGMDSPKGLSPIWPCHVYLIFLRSQLDACTGIPAFRWGT